MIHYILLLVMTMLCALASLFLKKASGSDGIIEMFKNSNLYLGGLLYLVAVILNVYILRFLDYSIVLPLTSIIYIWTMVLSNIVLKEKITKKKIAGVFLILTGAICVSI